MTIAAPAIDTAPKYIALTKRPVDCDRCHHPIAAQRPHWSTPDYEMVLCTRCMDDTDGWDNPVVCASRAAVNVRRAVMA
jgi:hypothetical protein